MTHVSKWNFNVFLIPPSMMVSMIEVPDLMSERGPQEDPDVTLQRLPSKMSLSQRPGLLGF